MFKEPHNTWDQTQGSFMNILWSSPLSWIHTHNYYRVLSLELHREKNLLKLSIKENKETSEQHWASRGG